MLLIGLQTSLAVCSQLDRSIGFISYQAVLNHEGGVAVNLLIGPDLGNVQRTHIVARQATVTDT